MQTYPQRHWKSLYQAALFETDRNKIPLQISVAEAEIIQRARSLFGVAGDHSEETDALDDALYMLHALETCLKMGGRDSREIAA